MRRIIIVFLVIIECCYLSEKTMPASIVDIDLKLQNGELGVVFLYSSGNESLLLKTIDKTHLIILKLGDKDNLLKHISAFNGRIDYLIAHEDYEISYQEFYYLKGKFDVDNIEMEISNDNLLIKYQNHSLCVLKNDNHSFRCDYLYLNNSNITLGKSELVIYSDLDDDFLEKLYDKWIDIYRLKTDSYNVLKIGENYDIISIPLK